MSQIPQWYEPNGEWPGLAALSPVISALAVLIAVLTTIFGDLLKTKLGGSGRTKLLLKFGDEPPFRSHGWIDEISALQQVDVPADDRVRLIFYKLQARNEGHLAAKFVSVWIKTIEHREDQNRPKPLENMMSLRWSDIWHFVTDPTTRRVYATDISPNFDLLPPKSAKFCDLCFYFSHEKIKKIGRFESDKLYLAVTNLPSNSYSMSPGRHLLSLVLVSENSMPEELNLEIDFQPKMNRVTFTPVKSNGKRAVSLQQT